MEAEQPAQVDATSEWPQNIAAAQPAQMSATATSEEVTPEASDWIELTEESVDVQPVQPAEQPESEIPSWMQNIEVEKAPESESEIGRASCRDRVKMEVTEDVRDEKHKIA